MPLHTGNPFLNFLHIFAYFFINIYIIYLNFIKFVILKVSLFKSQTFISINDKFYGQKIPQKLSSLSKIGMMECQEIYKLEEKNVCLAIYHL